MSTLSYTNYTTGAVDLYFEASVSSGALNW